MKKRVLLISIICMIVIGAIIVVASLMLRDNADKPLSAAELLDLGEKYLLEMNYEQAVVQFSKVIEIEPKNVRAYLGGTDAYLHIDKIPDAIEWLNSGIEMTDNENLAHVLVAVDKSVIEGYIALVEAYEAEGWFEKALELLRRVYEETGDEIIGRKLGIIQSDEILSSDDYVVQWIDPEFERMVRLGLNKPTDDILHSELESIREIVILGNTHCYINDLAYNQWSYRFVSHIDDGTGTLTAFYGIGEHNDETDIEEYTEKGNIQSITDIIYFANISSITVIANHISDLSPLLELNAENLYANFWANDISDVEMINRYRSDSNQPIEQFVEIGDVFITSVD